MYMYNTPSDYVRHYHCNEIVNKQQISSYNIRIIIFSDLEILDKRTVRKVQFVENSLVLAEILYLEHSNVRGASRFA